MENIIEMDVAATKESKLTKFMGYTPSLATVGRGVGRAALWGFAALGVVTAIGLVSSVRHMNDDETEEN